MIAFISKKRLIELKRKEQLFNQFQQNEVEKELLKSSMNIKTLQNQISPHFLYNSLECIRGMAIIKGVPEIADITEMLSNFYRYSISAKKDIVTVLEELENAENYAGIQKFRFGDKFEFETYIDEDAKDVLKARIPKLTLQPFIENAILHGFKDQLIGGKIKVEISKSEYRATIKIIDNGQGIEREKLRSIQNQLLDIEESTVGSLHHNRIALKNVHRRLQLLFGEEYGVTIYSSIHTGTEIIIHIPLNLEEEIISNEEE